MVINDGILSKYSDKNVTNKKVFSTLKETFCTSIYLTYVIEQKKFGWYSIDKTFRTHLLVCGNGILQNKIFDIFIFSITLKCCLIALWHSISSNLLFFGQYPIYYTALIAIKSLILQCEDISLKIYWKENTERTPVTIYHPLKEWWGNFLI